MVEDTGKIVVAGLMPHAPVLIPEVGQGREREAAASVNALRQLARAVHAAGPETLILISPHSPRRPGAFGIWQDSRIAGSLARFGCPGVKIDLPVAGELSRGVITAARSAGLETWSILGQPPDHGASVPLWFLQQAGWNGPTVLLGLNYPGDGGLPEFGGAIASAVRASGLRAALIASGDMSHALKPGAPCGFQPLAVEFDRTFVELVQAGAYRELATLDAELRELAAEDVVDSTLLAAAAIDWRNDGHAVLSYEGPFGVGYSVAVLFQEAAR